MDDTVIWDDLATATAAAGYTLTPALVAALLAAARDHGGRPGPASGSPAGAPVEFLLPVDAAGGPPALPPAVIASVEDALSEGHERALSTGRERALAERGDRALAKSDVRAPAGATGVQGWLSRREMEGRPVLLAARWLCHRLGLRHRTAQLILDHPTDAALTFVQVRGLDKEEAPAAFDLPCAGHVVGLESVAATLTKELHEELGLPPDALRDLRQVSVYASRDLPDGPAPQGAFRNVELRTVFRAQLRPEAFWEVRFVDREVAALAVISLSALRDWVARRPGRTASGLRGSIALYTTEP